MELLSPGPMLAVISQGGPPALLTGPFSPQEFLHPTVPFIILIVASEIAGLLAGWLASKMMAHEDVATFGNAARVWLFRTLLCFAIGFAGGLAFSMVQATGDSLRIMLVQFGTAGLVLLICLLVPMKIYVIGLLRALIIAVIVGLAEMTVAMGLELTVLKGATSVDHIAWLKSLSGSFSNKPEPVVNSAEISRAASNEIDALLNTALHPVGGAPSLEAQEAQVEVLQQKLQARHNSLPPDDAHEQAVFQNQLNRYMSFLNTVKALRRVKSTNPTPAAPGDTHGSHSPVH